MIEVLPGDVYYSSQNIIFNPVGINESTSKSFLEKVKRLYPDAYTGWQNGLYDEDEHKSLGDIQLVYIDNNQLIMNGYCINSAGEIDNFALCKTLVELCNLAYEYCLSVGIEYVLGVKDSRERKIIDLITRVIFEDTIIDVKLFDRNARPNIDS